MSQIKYCSNIIGKSKFDKLRRISVIKTVAEKMDLKEGDEVEFSENNGQIVIQRKPREEEIKHIQPIVDTYIEKYRQCEYDEILTLLKPMTIKLSDYELAILKESIKKDMFLYRNDFD